MAFHANDQSAHDRADEQQMLDRLVDGELNEAQRRELLLKLDGQSDGWRRCALAFLEAQAWGRELRSVTRSSTLQVEQSTPISHTRRSWMAGPLGTLLATAASFLIALGLGLAWQGGERGLNDAPKGEPIAGNSGTRQAPIVPATGERTPRQNVLDPNSPQAQYGTVVVALDGNQDGVVESWEVPVVAGGGLDESWLHSQPGSLPPHVLRALERLGHRVEQNRQYYPIDLNDGRRLVVPVDQIDVHYVGDRTYQ